MCVCIHAIHMHVTIRAKVLICKLLSRINDTRGVLSTVLLNVGNYYQSLHRVSSGTPCHAPV